MLPSVLLWKTMECKAILKNWRQEMLWKSAASAATSPNHSADSAAKTTAPTLESPAASALARVFASATRLGKFILALIGDSIAGERNCGTRLWVEGIVMDGCCGVLFLFSNWREILVVN
jgi:hypothetical protein